MTLKYTVINLVLTRHNIVKQTFKTHSVSSLGLGR